MWYTLDRERVRVSLSQPKKSRGEHLNETCSGKKKAPTTITAEYTPTFCEISDRFSLLWTYFSLCVVLMKLKDLPQERDTAPLFHVSPSLMLHKRPKSARTPFKCFYNTTDLRLRFFLSRFDKHIISILTYSIFSVRSKSSVSPNIMVGACPWFWIVLNE